MLERAETHGSPHEANPISSHSTSPLTGWDRSLRKGQDHNETWPPISNLSRDPGESLGPPRRMIPPSGTISTKDWPLRKGYKTWPPILGGIQKDPLVTKRNDPILQVSSKISTRIGHLGMGRTSARRGLQTPLKEGPLGHQKGSSLPPDLNKRAWTSW